MEAGVVRADLTDYGQAFETLKGANAVIHLANIPAPGLGTPAVTFNANLTMNFNVFLAAARLGLRRVVWASSETTLGLFFGIGPQQWPSLEAEVSPRYAPVDEDHYPLPTSTYALSKVASETVAEHVAQWSGIPFVALRFSNIMVQDDYEEFPVFLAGSACTQVEPLGVRGRPGRGHRLPPGPRGSRRCCRSSPSFIIAAADTVMNRSSSELLAEVFPGVPLTREVAEFDTLLAIDRARQAIGYEPQHTWRDHVPGS